MSSTAEPYPTEMAPSAQVSLQDVTLHYGNGVPVLDGLTVNLERGTFSFLTGPSGTGKSTLLSIMGLSRRPSSGQVWIDSINMGYLSAAEIQERKRTIGFISQDFRLIDHLSLYDNVALPLRTMGIKQEDYDDDVKELLHWVGLGGALDAFPATLSGGEKQRVAIARAVIAKPSILLADEPTGNVDPEMGQRLMRLFLEMNRMGTTILIATHDVSVLEGIRADTYQLNDGKIQQTRWG